MNDRYNYGLYEIFGEVSEIEVPLTKHQREMLDKLKCQLDKKPSKTLWKWLTIVL